MEIEFSLIFKKTPWSILRNFTMYKFSAGIHSNIVLSTICRSPTYFIKRFPNPNLNIFVFTKYTILFSQTQQSLIYYLLDMGDIFRYHLDHHQALLQKYINPLHIFVEGPDDDSSGIETCRSSPINNALKIVVFGWTILYILYSCWTLRDGKH